MIEKEEYLLKNKISSHLFSFSHGFQNIWPCKHYEAEKVVLSTIYLNIDYLFCLWYIK